MLDLETIRRVAISAMFSDDVLLESVVLKGGNALNLVHGIGRRSSIDIDFSLADDFSNVTDVERRIFRALDDRFDALSHVVFDKSFERRPPEQDGKWGGYEVRFKLISRDKFREYGSDVARIRRESHVVGPLSERVFKIQISKHEYCEGKSETTLDAYTIYVYTPEMIAIEKLRAICQQDEEYRHRSKKAPRARDFYDIHAIVTERGVNLDQEKTAELVKNIFGAKDVPLDLIGRIRKSREFHRIDWAAVRQSVSGPLGEFDHYFDFVVRWAESAQVLWKE